jgi:hypothetical protein
MNFYAFSNPIMTPPVITEIYFGPGGWSMELMFMDYVTGNNLDSVRITGLYDTAEFVQGITFTPGEVFFVTQEDFQTPLDIHQDGDDLHLEVKIGNDWWQFDDYGFFFGNLPPNYVSSVSPPAGEESVAWQLFNWSNGGPYFWMVKELPNTIGSNAFEVSKRATFSGYVKDKNDEPMPWIKLDYCGYEFYHYTSPTVPEIFTDVNGYFYSDNMFCKKYYINFANLSDVIGDTIIYIEPDSANYFEFKLDTLLVGINENQPSIPDYSITNVPNPLSGQTTFILETNSNKLFQQGIIKIYSSEGYIVDILPVELSGAKQELNYSLADHSLPPGIYTYTLETGQARKASGKMVIGR